MRKTPWHIKDLIDLEYLLEKDHMEEEQSGYQGMAKRDREIYLKYIRPLKKKSRTLPPSDVIHAWLERRRTWKASDSAAGRVLPGEAFEEIRRLSSYGLTAAGLVTGAGLAFSLLSYRGAAPVNVSTYLGTFVFLQLLLLLLLLGLSLLRRFKRLPLRSSLVFILVTGLMTALMEKIRQQAFKKTGGTEKNALEGIKGLVKGKRQIYGSLFYWPVFILAQVFGIAFNVGVLGATLVKVLGADIAFGWQSTVQFSVQAIFHGVKILALPWSWFLPAPIAHPTLDHIQGSHMILKEGVYHLSTADLVSWWPFLCLSVFFYGLVPRLILLLIGFFAQQRALKRIDFSHTSCERLLRRMRTPHLSVEGKPEHSIPSRVKHPGDEGKEISTGSMEPTPSSLDRRLIVLVPDEIFHACPEGELEKILTSMGYSLLRKMRFGEDEKTNQEVINHILRMHQEIGPTAVMILREAWLPLIREDMDFLKHLRKALGKTSSLKIGLIGRPAPESIFTPVKEEDWKAWQQKIRVLGDPYLGLERMVTHHD